MKIPSIVIAGTNSGCGKTTISMGIMAALVKRGLRVQPFKVGPDYIDPMFHTFITGRYCRNLDSWLLDNETVKYLFANNSKETDIAVIEGVMGFYDGYGGKSIEGSTAHVSQIIGAPVILVINGEAMSLSAAAMVKGFADFESNINITGVIVNNVSGESHYKIIKEAIEGYTDIPVVGYLKKDKDIAIQGRHLGLVTSSEISDLRNKLDILAEKIEETIDLGMLIKLSYTSKDLSISDFKSNLKKIGQVRIAVALDNAFNFYYRDNFDLLEKLGAELVFFSPLKDNKLPENIDGLYIGGGYPEIWAKSLQDNESIKEEIRMKTVAGLPVYAECGGFMYLTDSITDKEGNLYKMTGAIPGDSKMTSSLKRFGYVYINIINDCILADGSSEIKAHEFHYSETQVREDIKNCYYVSKTKAPSDKRAWKCGYSLNNILAGYAHIHFWSNIEFARGFIRSCLKYKTRE